MRLRMLSLNKYHIYMYINKYHIYFFSETPCYHEEHDSEGSFPIHFKASERKFQKATRKILYLLLESFRGKCDGI